MVGQNMLNSGLLTTVLESLKVRSMFLKTDMKLNSTIRVDSGFGLSTGSSRSQMETFCFSKMSHKAVLSACD